MQDKIQTANTTYIQVDGHIVEPVYGKGKSIMQHRQDEITERYNAIVAATEAKWNALTPEQRAAEIEAFERRNKYHDDLY